MDKARVVDRLIDLRREYGERQADVAEAIGVSISAVGNYESGQRIPTDDVKMKYAKHYGVSVSDIFYT